ncbi:MULTISPECIES: efflux transporter outer membrane subunit [unclassified Mesorhizobium]|uniref:efflux transporter outer membrane subunit n=1 Tax=unclassified Mesorhizobium TaxID=325217 RepID=UPI000FD9C5EC|nr:MULTISPECIES: efflux transporter outer membrane subunit [unclassified Mesorhizobium]TGQ04850.1 efflux transporter outer membrane subunit [Mesorhizobium sp. M2E.F.Ca.ET.219.01.1.1]TGS14413.1 efflux transporter outer membrane subunit [Mesorhizobium sp. M2E.F.Ca.ET.209.01.1.1]TGT65440.1 efflux transporter outer membrane subunit [Mesorhizobium sp. M2E.F.Ca.ET.166.01.1.1]TGV97486.1 efflux transporter outer membrane subunit [Mesorhizobium sp. M2E.F.Ca.ET.154.01.1.1]
MSRLSLSCFKIVSLNVAAASCLLVTGCTTNFALQPPGVKVAKVWHATVPHGGRTGDLLSWWSTFSDRSLRGLLAASQSSSPSLESALAEIESARATLVTAQASLSPALTGAGAITRSATGGSEANKVPPATTASASLDASWEIDLFGKARQKSEAARLRVEQRVADWHGARVSLAAEVADYYIQYRACRELERTYAAELVSQRETIRAMQTAESSGFASSADLALAGAGAATSAATLTAQRAECEVLIKSIARLAGGDEPRARSLLAMGKPGIPTPKAFRIAAVPAEALRQRPDINALELEVAASLAEIGAAKADLYPSLSLGGSLTIGSSSLTGAAVPWSFGPALSIPLFDGGTRRAAVGSAAAAHNAAVATYKSGVLSAIAEVETVLVRIESTRRQIGDAATAARSYRAYFKAVDANWRAGGVSLLDREEARRSAQAAEVSLIETRRDAARYWIALYKALGGGWNDPRSVEATPEEKPH